MDSLCSLPNDNLGLSMSQDSTMEIPTSHPLIIPSSVQMDEDRSQVRDVPGNTDLPVQTPNPPDPPDPPLVPTPRTDDVSDVPHRRYPVRDRKPVDRLTYS